VGRYLILAGMLFFGCEDMGGQLGPNRMGFTDDGGVNQCDTNNGNCNTSENSDCNDYSYGYSCSCDDGYTQDLTGVAANCQSGPTCVDSIGRHYCLCQSGYTYTHLWGWEGTCS
jgi:hypothetical protein